MTSFPLLPPEEKTEMLGKLGEIYLSEGVEPGEIAHNIAEKTGMSYTWVMKYLPDKFKDVKSESARATRRVAKADPKRRVISTELKEPLEGTVAIKTYGNTDFVNVMLDRKFCKQLEEKAEKLETTPDKLIYNVILLIMKTRPR